MKVANPMDRPLITIPEAQRLLRWSRSKVVARIEAGDFVAVADGKRRKIVTGSVRAWLDRAVGCGLKAENDELRKRIAELEATGKESSGRSRDGGGGE